MLQRDVDAVEEMITTRIMASLTDRFLLVDDKLNGATPGLIAVGRCAKYKAGIKQQFESINSYIGLRTRSHMAAGD
jgi:hypothetical protein